MTRSSTNDEARVGKIGARVERLAAARIALGSYRLWIASVLVAIAGLAPACSPDPERTGTATTGSGVSSFGGSEPSSGGANATGASAMGANATAGSATGGTSVTSGGAGTSTGGGASDGLHLGTGGGNGGSAGNAAPLGPDLTDLTSFAEAPCTTTPTVTPASAIPSVGVATFTTDLEGADSAIIQFGKTADYTLEAPVNWRATQHRTLILGMPANTEVHYRVVVFAGPSACTGPDATFQTGAPVSGAPDDLTPMAGPSAASVAPGFIIAEAGTFAYIINKQGEVVWAHRFPLGITHALMSWDGMYMYGGIGQGDGGSVYRVGMDGEGEVSLTLAGHNPHHDLVVTPTGIAYLANEQEDECDCIFTANADGSNSSCLINLEVVFGKFQPGSPGFECHVNAIRYYDDTKSFSVSDREKDAIAFFSNTGELLGSVGAQPTSSTPNHALAEGAGTTWRVQHGHDWYAPDKIVLWSNGSFSIGQSRLLHYTINGTSATLDWEYTGAGNSPILGDAQHLPNGNFLATNCPGGPIHEIDSQQMLVQAFDEASSGYTSHRTTLYGRPPGR